MKQVGSWFVVFLGMGLLMVFLLNDLSDSRANELRAQAVLVNAQSAARMDYLAGVMPYVIMGLGVLVFAVIILFLITGVVAVFALTEHNRTLRQMYEQQSLLRRSIVLEISGSPRRFYKRLAANQKFIVDG